MSRTVVRALLLGALVALVVAFFAFDLDRFASLGALKAQQASAEAWRARASRTPDRSGH